VLLGADHLGPYPWRDQPSEIALQKACDLTRACVLAGYTKIHLDTSMTCADDGGPRLADDTIAQRAAILCGAAEGAWQRLPPGSPRPFYVVGTEVPTPGGETLPGEAPSVTKVGQLHHSLEVFRAAFHNQKMSEAWERVIGVDIDGKQTHDDFSLPACFTAMVFIQTAGKCNVAVAPSLRSFLLPREVGHRARVHCPSPRGKAIFSRSLGSGWEAKVRLRHSQQRPQPFP
jgi:hypothetical protein